MVISAHPDDETLGCGGTLLSSKEKGCEIYWLIITNSKDTFSRKSLLEKVSQVYGFKSFHQLDFLSSTLDTVAMREIIHSVGEVFHQIKPEVVYLPFFGDIHSDHRIVFDAVSACTKWFRFPSIKRILCYETLSETDFALNPTQNCFKPNIFTNIQKYLDKKLEIMKLFKQEIQDFPFPRSTTSIEALARLRGSQSGFYAAEAFMLLKEINP